MNPECFDYAKVECLYISFKPVNLFLINGNIKKVMHT